MSIPGKLPERIDPWLDSPLSSGWIVRPFVQGVTIVTLKVEDLFFMKMARREFCPVSYYEPLKSRRLETWAEVIEAIAIGAGRGLLGFPK
jgi:hypothetical protein